MMIWVLWHSVQLYSNQQELTDNSILFIQIIFANNKNYLKTVIFKFDVTGHFLIFILYRNIVCEINHTKTIKYRLVNWNSVNRLIFNLSNICYDEVISANNCNIAMKKLDKIIGYEFNVCCPVKSKEKYPKR